MTAAVASRLLPLLRRCRGHVLLHSMFHNSLDQAVRDRLIKRKSQIALLSRIARNCLLQPFMTFDRRIKPDVVLECSEVHQSTVQSECRDSVTDCLLRFGCRAGDGRSYPFENALNLRRKQGDVFVDALRWRLIGCHDSCDAWEWDRRLTFDASGSQCHAVTSQLHRGVRPKRPLHRSLPRLPWPLH